MTKSKTFSIPHKENVIYKEIQVSLLIWLGDSLFTSMTTVLFWCGEFVENYSEAEVQLQMKPDGFEKQYLFVVPINQFKLDGIIN